MSGMGFGRIEGSKSNGPSKEGAERPGPRESECGECPRTPEFPAGMSGCDRPRQSSLRRRVADIRLDEVPGDKTPTGGGHDSVGGRTDTPANS